MADFKLGDSNFRPMKAGYSFVEINATSASPETNALVPLGKTYRSIKPVAVACSAGSASVKVVDKANVSFTSTAAGDVTITLECEG